jgi:hypothetical protein
MTDLSHATAKPIDVNNQAAKEKALLRLYITNKVLLKLGYTESRILECLEALGPRLVSGDDKITGGWEDALDWVSVDAVGDRANRELSWQAVSDVASLLGG